MSNSKTDDIDFNDGDEDFNEGDTPFADVDFDAVAKLQERFSQVTDRASAVVALAELYGSKLEVK